MLQQVRCMKHTHTSPRHGIKCAGKHPTHLSGLHILLGSIAVFHLQARSSLRQTVKQNSFQRCDSSQAGIDTQFSIRPAPTLSQVKYLLFQVHQWQPQLALRKWARLTLVVVSLQQLESQEHPTVLCFGDALQVQRLVFTMAFVLQQLLLREVIHSFIQSYMHAFLRSSMIHSVCLSSATLAT